jgi:hypothetical protein
VASRHDKWTQVRLTNWTHGRLTQLRDRLAQHARERPELYPAYMLVENLSLSAVTCYLIEGWHRHSERRRKAARNAAGKRRPGPPQCETVPD